MKKLFTSDLGLVAILVALLSAVAIVQAQTATTCPAGSTSGTVKANAPFTLFWCSPASDNVTGAMVYGLGASAVPVQAVAINAGPFTDGLVQMRGTVPAQPRGRYTFTLRATNSTGEGLPSVPFDLGVVDPIPTAPVNLRAQ